MALCYRLTITLINIIFPPFAVILLTGFGMDTLINWYVHTIQMLGPASPLLFPPSPSRPPQSFHQTPPNTPPTCSLLFLAAVLPSHIHGFYISCTYFARRRRVRKGRYPGGPKSFIVSDDVLNGGAPPDEVRRLARRVERGGARSRSRAGRRRGSGRGGVWEKGDVAGGGGGYY